MTRTEAITSLRAADLDADERGKLRRRIEDALRKNPGLLLQVAATLAESDQIRIDDLV
jgi:hypothetical protein